MMAQPKRRTGFERFAHWVSPLQRRIAEVRAATFRPEDFRTRQLYWIAIVFCMIASGFFAFFSLEGLSTFGSPALEGWIHMLFFILGTFFMGAFLGILYLHKVAPKKIVGNSEAFPYYPKVFPIEWRTYKLKDRDGNVSFLTIAMQRLGTLLGGAFAGDGPLELTAAKGGRMNESAVLDFVRLLKKKVASLEGVDGSESLELELPEVRDYLSKWRIKSYDERLLEEYEKAGREPRGSKSIYKLTTGKEIVSWAVPPNEATELAFEFNIGHYTISPGATIVRANGDMNDGIEWLRPWIRSSSAGSDLSKLATILVNLDPLPAVKDLDRTAPHQQRTNVEWLIENLEAENADLRDRLKSRGMFESEVALSNLPAKVIEQDF
jgi:hypothetical protein